MRMFEEEADKWANSNHRYAEFEIVDAAKTAFIKGAELGYRKATEWHKGELPQVTDKNKETLYLAWTKYGRAGSPCIVTPLKVKYINLWTGAIVDKEDVVSWKEIELPTE
jgi:hypothetical protein